MLLTDRQTDKRMRANTFTSFFVRGNNFCTQRGYFAISNVTSMFKFNFLAVVVSEISGGPKFTLGDCATLEAT